ncbi:MAG: single-stranded DNA-binding protein [Nocardioides sp.]
MRAKQVTADDSESPAANEVRLVGRLSRAADSRELPSGDVVGTFRVVVPRLATRGRPGVDAVDCAVWTARTRRVVAGWQPGDVVEVRGALRRRFYRQAGAVASRVEIEVTQARRLRRGRG